VIGREGTNVRAADAFSHIAGFTIFNDWSCRDLQRDEMEARLGPAKGKDAATSLGPWMVTTDELDSRINDGRLNVRCTLKVNGEQWMENDASLMYHSWGDMVERASRDSRIVPGDVLGSGTVTGGSIGEAIRNGMPAPTYRSGTSSRSRSKPSACCATRSAPRSMLIRRIGSARRRMSGAWP
jgi:fumarylacetoacetate (FAA) hydrolase